MAGTGTLDTINSIPKFHGTDDVEGTRSFSDILQISSPILCKIVSGLEKPKHNLKSREEDPKNGSDNVTGNNVNPPMLMTIRLGIQQINTSFLVF